MPSDGLAPAQLLLGLRVVDRTDEDPDPAAVINTPGVPADEWSVNDEYTVASYPDNEPYPDDALIAVVGEHDEVDEHRLAVDEAPLKLTELASQGVSFFAFPTPRLQIVGEGRVGDESGGDALRKLVRDRDLHAGDVEVILQRCHRPREDVALRIRLPRHPRFARRHETAVVVRQGW